MSRLGEERDKERIPARALRLFLTCSSMCCVVSLLVFFFFFFHSDQMGNKGAYINFNGTGSWDGRMDGLGACWCARLCCSPAYPFILSLTSASFVCHCCLCDDYRYEAEVHFVHSRAASDQHPAHGLRQQYVQVIAREHWQATNTQHKQTRDSTNNNTSTHTHTTNNNNPRHCSIYSSERWRPPPRSCCASLFLCASCCVYRSTPLSFSAPVYASHTYSDDICKSIQQIVNFKA